MLARHRRLRDELVRFLSGTDDHSLKNVEAAAIAGVPVAEFVTAKADWFAALREPLDVRANKALDEVLGVLVDACGTLAEEIKPFLPAASERIGRALLAGDPESTVPESRVPDLKAAQYRHRQERF